jgi:3-oxoacyl-[acyl-carrier-protein] synthase-1
MPGIAIVASGMVTGVGLTSPSTCAAIRCAIDRFEETRYVDRSGEWIIGSAVPLEKPWRGLDKLTRMLAPAIRECLRDCDPREVSRIPLLLCVAERSRPARQDGLEQQLFGAVEAELGVRFDRRSRTVAAGRVGAAVALNLARELVHGEGCRYCVIAGVDSYLLTGTVSAYEKRDRLLTTRHSNGFVPGEAAAAVLVAGPKADPAAELICLGVGLARETATIESDLPLRADGMVLAVKNAMAESGVTVADTDYRLTDLNCEQYGFREAVLTLGRTLRVIKEEHDIWHPADCIGEVGAAIGPCVLGIALTAARKGYAPGPGVLCHFANDDGERAALLLRYGPPGGSHGQ